MTKPTCLRCGEPKRVRVVASRRGIPKRKLYCPCETRAHKRAWIEANPEKRRAHCRVRYAIKTGKLSVEPCEACGEAAEAHHEDYSRPLDVTWLCPKHHKARHAELASFVR